MGETWKIGHRSDCFPEKILCREQDIFDWNTAGSAWSHLDGAKDERERFVAVLEIPPVVSAETAVRVQIVKDVKGKQ